MSLLRDKQRRERESLPPRLRQALPHPPLGIAPGPIRTCPRSILNIARHLQKVHHREERQQPRYGLSGWKRRLSAKPRFEDWLRVHGFADQAEHWRHRHTLENIPADQWEARDLPEGQTGDPRGVYAAHRQAILQNSPEIARSSSTLDGLIAMHMREDGFKREDIVEAVRHCAPEAPPGQGNRNWQRYAERAADYAFGVPGDLWLVRRTEGRKQEQEIQQEAMSYEPPREVPRMLFR